MDECINAQHCDCEQPKIPTRSLEDLVMSLTREYCQISCNYKKLHDAIIADPACISDHHKALWNTQLSAMGSYRAVLAERIKDVLDQDSK